MQTWNDTSSESELLGCFKLFTEKTKVQTSLILFSIYALESGLKDTGHLCFPPSQRHSRQIGSTQLGL